MSTADLIADAPYFFLSCLAILGLWLVAAVGHSIAQRNAERDLQHMQDRLDSMDQDSRRRERRDEDAIHRLVASNDTLKEEMRVVEIARQRIWADLVSAHREIQRISSSLAGEAIAANFYRTEITERKVQTAVHVEEIKRLGDELAVYRTGGKKVPRRARLPLASDGEETAPSGSDPATLYVGGLAVS